MLLHIAWRNLLRNTKRSMIIITAIAVGLWGGLVSSSISLGLSEETVESALQTRFSHIQVHAHAFTESRNLRDVIPRGAQLAEEIGRIAGVNAVTARIVADGMASTAETAVGVVVQGVDPLAEARVTSIARRLVDGDYLPEGRKGAVVIGQELAEKLGATLRSKIVLTVQDMDGTIVAGSFRVSGIYETDSAPFDGVAVFVRQNELADLTATGNHVHEIAITVEHLARLEDVAALVRESAPHLSIETWKELAPELDYIQKYTRIYLTIFLDIIIAALLFGITNTMLMSVLERVREFGMLSAIGMRGRKVFGMILLESLLLSLAGAAAGMGAGAGTVALLERTGIDLSAFGEGLRQWGYADLCYPMLPFSLYQEVTLSVIVAAVLAAVYPAWKAIRLDPAAALRTY